MHKGRIIIKTKNTPKVKKVKLPADLKKPLTNIFYEYGGIQALVDSAKLSRNTLGAIKKHGTATEESIEKLRIGVEKILKSQPAA